MNDIGLASRAALNAGLNTEALDLVRKAAADEHGAAELHYLAALASARMGAIGEAQKWLAKVDGEKLDNGALAVEVWSLAGRIAKERYSSAKCKTGAEALEAARVAIECYQRASSLSGSAYPAVNAATMAMLGGDLALARTLACEALAALEPGADHWQRATAGEARLILGEVDEARALYTDAHRLAAGRYGDIASMRRQLLLIGSSDAVHLLEAVPAPKIIAFSGHMIDRDSRGTPRFPPEIEPKVKAAIRRRVASLMPCIGYAQAACGADILFLEALQDAGMQTNVMLPFAKDDFIQFSVSFAGPQWVSRFENVLARATRVVQATEEAFLGDEVLFEHATNVLHGMALLHAAELLTQPLMLALREPCSTARIGGTVANTQAWVQRGGVVEDIDLAAIRGGGTAVAAFAEAADPQEALLTIPRHLKSLLFADIKGFSKLLEHHTPKFVSTFLEICKITLDSLQHQPIDSNTRGDALFITFDLPGHAAECALCLLRALGTIDWPSFGLPPETTVRIGLHTGPVYKIHDPVMAKDTFYGTHVNRTARLEPIVQPGHIFVTEAFAASLAADGEKGFKCQYIGAMPLAKQFGEARLYRLDREIGD